VAKILVLAEHPHTVKRIDVELFFCNVKDLSLNQKLIILDES
jgi:hypothetical protein